MRQSGSCLTEAERIDFSKARELPISTASAMPIMTLRANPTTMTTVVDTGFVKSVGHRSISIDTYLGEGSVESLPGERTNMNRTDRVLHSLDRSCATYTSSELLLGTDALCWYC